MFHGYYLLRVQETFNKITPSVCLMRKTQRSGKILNDGILLQAVVM